MSTRPLAVDVQRMVDASRVCLLAQETRGLERRRAMMAIVLEAIDDLDRDTFHSDAMKSIRSWCLMAVDTPSVDAIGQYAERCQDELGKLVRRAWT